MSFAYLLIAGLLVHIVFLLSIFDIYFKSPILTSIGSIKNEILPPGKRVVLVSVDGLRADSLFGADSETSGHVAEYVQEVINRRGSWGLSQSRVPTESRPGHVAMLAGFYEDPSAVTRGWRENPVDFDSIFNRSRCSFAWGSTDILNIFFKGLRHNCAFAESYNEEQNFAGDTRQYDNWVYEKLENFMKQSAGSRIVLHEEGIFFFMHLLGQDTSGHTDKPHSVKYKENLKNVDNILRKIDNLFYDFYGDDKTTFIVTSDHGMTNWGSHGAGNAEETDTPIVAWGAGIKKPSDPLKQINISQADITPMLAILLGVPIPVNSVGTLPIGFLNMSRRRIAEAVELNARQMVAQYLKALQCKQEQIISWFHKPFKKLLVDEIDAKFSSIREATVKEKYSVAIKESQILIDTCLEGLKYYQNYFQTCLLVCIGSGYLGWITYLVLVLIQDRLKSYPQPSSLTLRATFAVFAFFTFGLVSMQRLPWSFHCYILLPQVLWYRVLNKGSSLLVGLDGMGKKQFFQLSLFIVVAVEILVLSFFKRWFLCLSVAILLWWSRVGRRGSSRSSFAHTLWSVSGIALAAFLLVPTIGSRPRPAVAAAAGVGLCTLCLAAARTTLAGTAITKGSRASVLGFALRFFSLAAAVFNNYLVHRNFEENHSVADINRYFSWFLFLFACCSLPRTDSDIFHNLVFIFINLSVPFVLLSITHEVLFIAILFVHLFCWIFVEDTMRDDKSTVSLFRIAYFFLTYIFLSFFGLGNVSSLNSFDPAWVRCFLTVFSPFLMSFLILFKTAIPFLVVSCALRTATLVSNVKPEKIFVIVLIYCNIMALNFLFLVKNEGSWLEIGISISHYVIQQVTIVFLVLLFGLAKFLVTSSGDVQKPNIENCTGEYSENSLPVFYGTSRNKTHTY